MKTEAGKLYSRVFWIFLPNFIKIAPCNFELYRFKVKTFFETQCRWGQMTWCTHIFGWRSDVSNWRRLDGCRWLQWRRWYILFRLLVCNISELRQSLNSVNSVCSLLYFVKIQIWLAGVWYLFIFLFFRGWRWYENLHHHQQHSHNDHIRHAEQLLN